jgi:peptide deformylase
MRTGMKNIPIRELQEKNDVRIATIVDDNDWVKAKAREIDLDKELDLAGLLDGIMRYFREKHLFVGVSSNNIHWNLTPTPIRQILIPTEKRRYISLINPKILKLAGKDIPCVEACGSIPRGNYLVKRKPYVLISGYTLEKESIELEYGSTRRAGREEPVMTTFRNKEWIIQHEMDHLRGITIKDIGTPVDLKKFLL